MLVIFLLPLKLWSPNVIDIDIIFYCNLYGCRQRDYCFTVISMIVDIEIFVLV